MKTMVFFKEENFKHSVISDDSLERIETTAYFFRTKEDIKYDILYRYDYTLKESEYFIDIAGIQYYAESVQELIQEINNDGTIATIQNPFQI